MLSDDFLVYLRTYIHVHVRICMYSVHVHSMVINCVHRFEMILDCTQHQADERPTFGVLRDKLVCCMGSCACV